jgi:hypothetical protein
MIMSENSAELRSLQRHLYVHFVLAITQDGGSFTTDNYWAHLFCALCAWPKARLDEIKHLVQQSREVEPDELVLDGRPDGYSIDPLMQSILGTFKKYCYQDRRACEALASVELYKNHAHDFRAWAQRPKRESAKPYYIELRLGTSAAMAIMAVMVVGYKHHYILHHALERAGTPQMRISKDPAISRRLQNQASNLLCLARWVQSWHETRRLFTEEDLPFSALEEDSAETLQVVWEAVAFVILHEFAHHVFGHVGWMEFLGSEGKINKDWQKYLHHWMETQADLFAVGWLHQLRAARHVWNYIQDHPLQLVCNSYVEVPSAAGLPFQVQKFEPYHKICWEIGEKPIIPSLGPFVALMAAGLLRDARAYSETHPALVDRGEAIANQCAQISGHSDVYREWINDFLLPCIRTIFGNLKDRDRVLEWCGGISQRDLERNVGERVTLQGCQKPFAWQGSPIRLPPVFQVRDRVHEELLKEEDCLRIL